MTANNPHTLKVFRLEAQRDQNTREQASLRHKLLFSKYPHHQTPEGQQMILDLLASAVRVGVQIRARLADAEREAAEARPAQIAAFDAAVAKQTQPIDLPGLDRGVQNYF